MGTVRHERFSLGTRRGSADQGGVTMTDIDMGPFADPAYWSHGSDTRADMFRLLRDEAPVLFMEEP